MMDCKVCAAASGDFLWAEIARGGGGGGGSMGKQMGGGFSSSDGEHDLAMMVSEFLEYGSSGGPDSRYSSDSESGLCDMANLADKISVSSFSTIDQG